ncbi:MAG: aromatic amino acid lyase [Campylobacterales bacterium]|nr:aromatic amino acid lyase [Campylobacterales bacterium]
MAQLQSCSTITLDDSVLFQEQINAAHRILHTLLEQGMVIYGVNTGFGENGNRYIPQDARTALQQSLYRFHGCGLGALLEEEIVRMVMIIRLISLCKGVSGVRYGLLSFLARLIGEKIYPCIPSLGSVGASGDLTPLSYVAAVMAGEREVSYQNTQYQAAELFARLGIEPWHFEAKEALAIMNGTAVMSAIATVALKRFKTLIACAERITAALYELLRADSGAVTAFIHEQKPFKGQIEAAHNIRSLLHGATRTQNMQMRQKHFHHKAAHNIQDRYSLRCAPQIIGMVRDTADMATQWIEIEINSASDNPLIDTSNATVHFGGNFYGGHVAQAMDSVRIAAANLADLVDKQCALLFDGKFNGELGADLRRMDQTINHGFKAMQITLSSLCGDVIMNTTAASIHSRPTESLNQDKVSMGTTAGLRFLEQIETLQQIYAIALLGIAQGVDIITPTHCSKALRWLHDSIRSIAPPLLEDRRMDHDIHAVTAWIKQEPFCYHNDTIKPI